MFLPFISTKMHTQSQTLYNELDIDRELQRGLLPGAISVAGKLRPALTNVGQKMLIALADAIRNLMDKVCSADLQIGMSASGMEEFMKIALMSLQHTGTRG